VICCVTTVVLATAWRSSTHRWVGPGRSAGDAGTHLTPSCGLHACALGVTGVVAAGFQYCF
jgi:hypothetical protein